jgi:hypothetical protein
MSEISNFQTALDQLKTAYAAMETSMNGSLGSELNAVSRQYWFGTAWGRRVRHGTALPHHMRILKDAITSIDHLRDPWPPA